MQKPHIALYFYFVVLLNALTGLFSNAAVAKVQSGSAISPKVVLLNSYHPQFQWTAELTQGVQQALAPLISPEYLHIEYMDERRFIDDKQYHQQLVQLLKHKYHKYQPSLVITSDDAAFHFVLEYGKEVFGDVPMVFSGVNIFKPEWLHDKHNITGIQEGMAIEENLNFIAKLQPKVQRIVMLGDSTGFGSTMVTQAQKIQQQWQGVNGRHIDLEIWDTFKLAELYQKVEVLPETTALLMLAIHTDVDGNYFSYSAQLPELAAHSSVPIYGMWGGLLIGNGVIGGVMNDPFEHGQAVAKLAVKILTGVSVSELPVQAKAQYLPVIDYPLLARYNINANNAPQGTKFLDRPLNFYQQNKMLVNITLAVFGILLSIIVVMVINIQKRISLEHKLKHFNAELEAKVEQRTADLHSKNKQLQRLSRTDVLTGVENRRAAVELLPKFIQRAQNGATAFSLAILDIDYFKQVNDTYGHHVGDEALITVAKQIEQSLRPSDKVYRWGGEEFLIALPDTDLPAAKVVCERINQAIKRCEVKPIAQLTVSIGIASYQQGLTFDGLIQHADQALYQAKDNGRDRVELASG